MKRQLTYGFLTLISVAVFGMILIFLNAIPRSIKVLNVFGTRVPLQAEWDMTTNKRYTLSDQSIKTVRNLTAPVQAIAFAPAASQDHQQMETLLKRYAIQSTQFTFRIEDAEKNPLIARKYGIKSTRSLILESKGQRETINLPSANDDVQCESRITAGLMLVTMDYGADADPYWAVAGMRVSAAVWTVLWVAAARPALRLRRRSVPLLVLIGLMIVTANTLFATATTRADLSVVAVLGWLSPAVTIFCARVVLHEHLRPVQWLAAAAVLTGVVCLALG